MISRSWIANLSCALLLISARAALAQAPQTSVVSPNNGAGPVGAYQTFTFTFNYASAGDAQGITWMQGDFGPFGTQNSCFFIMGTTYPYSLTLEDDGGVWMGNTAIDVNTHQGTTNNSRCRITSNGLTANVSGNTVQATVSVQFLVTGTQNIYMVSGDNAGYRSGFAGPVGVYQAGSTPPPPYNPTVSPSGGTGLSRTFTFTFDDTSGGQHVQWIEGDFGATLGSAASCFFIVGTAPPYSLTLMDDSGSWFPSAISTNNPSQTTGNSRCTISANGLSGSVLGNRVSVNVPVTFSANYPGTKNIYSQAGDDYGQYSGWFVPGTWTVGSASAPVTVTEGPAFAISAVAGTPQQFTFHYTDPSGTADIVYGQGLFNSNPNGPDGNGACQVEWNSSGSLNLLLTTGGGIDGAFGQTPAVALSNESCSIDTVNSSLTPTLTGYDVIVMVRFTNQFSTSTTTHQIYAFGENAERLSGSLQQVNALLTRAATADFTVVNNGMPITFQNAGACFAPADCRTASCSTSDANVLAQPSEQTMASLSLTVTANPQTQAGPKTITCTASGILARASLQVYDATPNITSITHFYGGSPIFTQGEGQVAVRITGQNLGNCGTLSVLSGSGISVDTSQPGYCGTQNVTRWSPQEIDAYFIIGSAASTSSIGVDASISDSGNSFLPQAGNPQSQSRGTGQMTIIPGPIPRISRAGTDITNQQVSVVVGEPISLSGSVLNLPTPSGATISGQSWTVQGTRVGGYSVTKNVGIVTPFADSGTSAISFFWVDGGTNTVTYSATLSNGAIYSASATFTIIRPVANFFAGSTTLNPPVSIINTVVGPGLYYGDRDNDFNAGLTFRFSITSSAAGDVGLLQVANSVRSNTKMDGTTVTLNTAGNPALDTSSEDSAFFENNLGSATTITIPAGQFFSALPGEDDAYSDSPGQTVTAFQSLSLSDQFQTYLMFRSETPGSIWVTLNVISWSWSGSATRPAGGWVIGPADTYTAPVPISLSSAALPQWTRWLGAVPYQ